MGAGRNAKVQKPDSAYSTPQRRATIRGLGGNPAGWSGLLPLEAACWKNPPGLSPAFLLDRALLNRLTDGLRNEPVQADAFTPGFDVRAAVQISIHSNVEPPGKGLRRDSIRQTYGGPLSIATDLMVWNVSKDEIRERLAVTTPNAWGVPGTARQPPPQPGAPDPMSDFIKSGEWGPGFNAQNKMLDEHAERYNLQDQDWRKTKPWYKGGN